MPASALSSACLPFPHHWRNAAVQQVPITEEGAEGKRRARHRLTPHDPPPHATPPRLTPGWYKGDIPQAFLPALKLREGKKPKWLTARDQSPARPESPAVHRRLSDRRGKSIRTNSLRPTDHLLEP